MPIQKLCGELEQYITARMMGASIHYSNSPLLDILAREGQHLKFWLDKSNQAAFDYARQITAHYAKSFYLCANMLPQEKRWATFAIYGFCRYADNLIDNMRNRSAAEILREVDFLTQELHVAYRTGESEHPILRPFIVAAQRYNIPIAHPLELLKGVQMDVQKARYANFEELYVFCYRVAAVVGLMMTHILEYSNETVFEYAEELGIAMQLTNILRDIQEDRRMGRIYLPLDELRKFDCSENDILEERMTPAFKELMVFQVKRAHAYYEAATPGVKMLTAEAQFAIHSASRIYRGILMKIEARDYNPFLGRVYVPKHRKLSILLREIVRTKFFSTNKRPAMESGFELR